MDEEYAVQIKGDTACVLLAGEIDLVAAPAVLEALHLALAMQPARIVIDLAAVTFLDSSGIHAVLLGYHDAARVGVGFALGPAAPNISRILALTGLGDGFPTEPATNKLGRRTDSD